MKYDEIMKLIDAGFTRDEIINMKEGEPPEEEQEHTSSEEKYENVNDELTKAISEMKDSITESFEGLKKEMMAINIMNATQNGDLPKTGEDIIADIINPFTRE